MQKYQKTLATSVVLLATIVTTSCESPTFDQGLNEPQALRNCYAAIRDKTIDSIEDCREYAQFHAPLYTEINQSHPYLAACEFSKFTLSYATKYYPKNSTLISQLKEQTDADCQYEK